MDPGMFHVKQPCVPVEHFGDDLQPDWRVELCPGGSFYWIVTDWHGETIAHGVKATLGEAVTEAVRWAT